jgi:hypothetical protein
VVKSHAFLLDRIFFVLSLFPFILQEKYRIHDGYMRLMLLPVHASDFNTYFKITFVSSLIALNIFIIEIWPGAKRILLNWFTI